MVRGNNNVGIFLAHCAPGGGGLSLRFCAYTATFSLRPVAMALFCRKRIRRNEQQHAGMELKAMYLCTPWRHRAVNLRDASSAYQLQLSAHLCSLLCRGVLAVHAWAAHACITRPPVA